MSYVDQIDERLSAAWLFYSRCSLYATTTVAHKSSKAAQQGANESDKIVYITALYSDGWTLLLERYNEVSEKYLSRRKIAPCFIILNIDRKDIAVVASVNSVKEDMKAIMRELRDCLRPEAQIPTTIQKIICPPQWDILEQSSKLLMEEVTFLSKRVDEITNMMISLVAQGMTLITIIIALIGILSHIFTATPKDPVATRKFVTNAIQAHSKEAEQKFEAQQQELSKINSSIITLQDLLGQNTLEINSFTTSLAELKIELEKKSQPIIINNVLKQEPSKKSIGIINVDASR